MKKRGSHILRFGNFSGGEASVFPYAAMPAKYSMLMQNCHISSVGGIGKIPGYAKVNIASVNVTLKTGFEYRKTDGTVQLLCAGGGSIFKVVGNGLTAIKTGLDNTSDVSFAIMNNLCIMANGVDAPMKYDGTTVSSLGGTPPATAFKVHVHKGRVWMIERTNKMLASHSILNGAEDYTGAGSGYIDFKYVLRKGDELVDIVTFVDLIVFVFKGHIAIYSGTTPAGVGADFSLVQLIEGVGAISTNSVQGTGTDLAIMSTGGVKSLKQVITTGNLNMDDISRYINPVLSQKISSTISVAANLAVGHYPVKSWLLFLVGDTVFVYSYLWKAWGRIVGADINGMFTTISGDLYLCGTNYLYKYGTGYDFAGVAPAMQWDTAWLSISRDGRKIYPKTADILVNPSANITVDLHILYDIQAAMPDNVLKFSIAVAATLIDDVTDFDSINPFDEINWQSRTPIFGGGRIMQMSFRNTSVDGPIELADIILQCIEGGI